MKFPDIPLSQLIGFVEEDSPFGDITSEAVIEPQICTAVISAREPLFLAGLAEVIRLSEWYNLSVLSKSSDGLSHKAGDRIATITGQAHTILLLERTLLNILGRMSGIATKARKIQDMVLAVNTRCRITATRKTAPGLRLMDKKAAMIGGADPHRFSLSDAVLIKDNHLVLVSVDKAVMRAKASGAYHRIEAEADTIDEALMIARAGVDIILLDNMTPGQVSEVLSLLSENRLREKVIVEVSGGITEDTLVMYASLPIDRISMGALTHSVTNSDFSLDIMNKG
ncbi:carboxylating nicotinate-nucleotide diphosphorylase [Methanospirillum sp.]|uniref:carboxylating nicotinate-nucleotide diphosphorylase n=1 Tax=Methanospirillum sp. TaxID=45200 RepID=UPI002983ED59|nr:carboxylating nicotinate-nucleotide diphosphorylase [Methanospirillum sp.]